MLQLDKEGLKIHFLILLSISSTSLLFPLEFCKIYSPLNEFISGKNQPTTQSRHSKAFCENMAKSDKQNPFHFGTKAIEAKEFLN